MWKSKDVYYVSDSTGILATNLGQALICQFPEINFYEEKFPFIQNVKEARETISHIRKQSGGRRPLIFSTIMDNRVRKIFETPEVEFFDVFDFFLGRLESVLEAKALRVPGFSHHIDDVGMVKRVEAIHFCLGHDDGTKIDEFDEAEIILLGVSRVGKTPVCVYLASQMGFKSANFPLTSEYLDHFRLPEGIAPNMKRVVGLTTTAELLHSARGKRYPESNYANKVTCLDEIQKAQQIFKKYNIPVINSAGKSIEETATQVIHQLGLSRKPWLKSL